MGSPARAEALARRTSGIGREGSIASYSKRASSVGSCRGSLIALSPGGKAANDLCRHTIGHRNIDQFRSWVAAKIRLESQKPEFGQLAVVNARELGES